MEKNNIYTPVITDEINLDFPCTIEELDTKKYRLDIDQDPRNGIIYLNIGYDNLKEYDSPLYLTIDDTKKLAYTLLEYARKAKDNIYNAKCSSIFVKDLTKNLESKRINSISIYPVSLANQDYFPGCMVFDILYFISRSEHVYYCKSKTIDVKYSARIVSCDYRLNSNNKYKLSDDLVNLFKDKYCVKDIEIFQDRFNELYDSINKIDLSNIDKDKIIENAFNAYTDANK